MCFLLYSSYYLYRLDKSKDHLCVFVFEGEYVCLHSRTVWEMISTQQQKTIGLFTVYKMNSLIMKHLTLQTQNHRIIEVGRPVMKSSIPTALLKQGQPHQAAQDKPHCDHQVSTGLLKKTTVVAQNHKIFLSVFCLIDSVVSIHGSCFQLLL